MDNANISTFQPPAPTPPPGGNLENRQPHSEPVIRPTKPGEINTKNMQKAQEIQSTHSDFVNLNEYEQTNLSLSLAKAGLPETGAIFNSIA